MILVIVNKNTLLVSKKKRFLFISFIKMSFVILISFHEQETKRAGFFVKNKNYTQYIFINKELKENNIYMN